jgi:hypothetical protein
MKKPKKITVKFFLNKNLQPINLHGELAYPLYNQITYDRKNTQIKCTYGNYYKSLEQAKRDSPYLFAFEEKILKRSVSYEISKLGDEFRLKGLGRKYDHYSLSIHTLFNNYLKMQLKDMLRRSAKPAHFLEVLHLEKDGLDFFVLYEAAQRLFDNLKEIIRPAIQEEMEVYRIYYQLYEPALKGNKYEFPVVIDWIDGTHIQQLKDRFAVAFAQDTARIERALTLIDKIIATKLELG